MTTVLGPNVHNIAIDGDFDDAQALVKAMFNDRGFADRFRCRAVNSINWARLMAQVVYYFYAAVRLGAPRALGRLLACRPAISATCSLAMSRRGWGCRSTG